MFRVPGIALRGVVALAGIVALAATLPSDVSAQKRMKKSEPTLIYVPTPQNVVDKMLEVAKVTKDDYVFDLGSGDGRIPITAAARYGARGFGVDINPKLIAEARRNAKIAGVSDRVEFRQQDLFKTSVRDATVVGLYLFVWANEKLRPRLISELRPGSRIVAHDFPIGDDWKPDLEEDIENRTVYLWYVPAQVAGRWEISGGPPGLSVLLQQRFQMIEGTASVNGRSVPLTNARLRGDAIEFTVAFDGEKPMLFRGRVNGGKIEPEAPVGAMTGWSAVRTSPATVPAVIRSRG
ncbi:MAG: class I SAM-dependent methyltransferase [Xanthobacteraceae bacterium]|nr:class I SAM-dependent methyltransferase [Xanthobacteraceae bacterium]